MVNDFLINNDKYILGKSAFVIQYIAGRFVEDYDPTLEDRYIHVVDQALKYGFSYRKRVGIDDKEYVLDIYDTAWECVRDVESLTKQREEYAYTHFMNGYFVVYSVTDLASFFAIPSVVNTYEYKFRGQTTPIVLVANKCDLIEERVVTTGTDAKRL